MSHPAPTKAGSATSRGPHCWIPGLHGDLQAWHAPWLGIGTLDPEPKQLAEGPRLSQRSSLALRCPF